MSERKKAYVMVGVSIIFCLMGYYRFFYGKSPAGTGPIAPSRAPAAASLPPVAPLPPEAPPRQAEPQQAFKGGVVKDIFEPVKSARTDPASGPTDKVPLSPMSFVLNGMISGNGRTLAIINGQFQQVGDLLGTYRIVRIGTKEVLLKGEDREITLRIIDYGQK